MKALALIAALLLASPAHASIESDLRGAFEAAVAGSVASADAQITVGSLLCSRPDFLRKAKGIGRFDFNPTLRPFGRLSARVEFRVGGRLESAIVMADVDVQAPVWVMNAPVDAGQSLDGLATLELRSLARLQSGALRATDSLDGRVASRSLPAGAVVTASFATRPVLVRRGDVVGLTVVVGSVQIRTRAEALRDGRLGDTVTVKSLEGAVVSATVDDAGRVVVIR